MFPMKKMLIRTLSFFLTMVLFTTSLLPGAAAVEYPGIESVTLEATASLLVDMSTGQVLHEVNADEMRYPASITKVMTALLTVEAVARGELSMDDVITVDAAALADITDDSSTANIVASGLLEKHGYHPIKFSDWIFIILGTSVVLWIGEAFRLFSRKAKN